MKPVIPMGSLPLTPPVRGSHNLKGCSHRLEGGQELGISFFGLPRMAVREAGLVGVQTERRIRRPYAVLTALLYILDLAAKTKQKKNY